MENEKVMHRDKRGLRQQSNRAILQVISAMIESYPDLRFGQILTSAGVIKRENATHWENEYYVESYDLLERVKKESTPKP